MCYTDVNYAEEDTDVPPANRPRWGITSCASSTETNWPVTRGEIASFGLDTQRVFGDEHTLPGLDHAPTQARIHRAVEDIKPEYRLSHVTPASFNSRRGS